jgi:spoIIIJ-associated protein
MKEFEFKGATKEEAIEKGLKQLNLKEEDVDVEVLSYGGFLSKVLVRLTPKSGEKTEENSFTPEVAKANEVSFTAETDEEDEFLREKPEKKKKAFEPEKREINPEALSLAAQSAFSFVEELVDKMRINCGVTYEIENDEVCISVTGADANIVIGYRGECLDAIQFLASTLVNESNKNHYRIHVDAGGYRAKRKEILEGLAHKNAKYAHKTGKRVVLDPMSPADRRIVHAALTDDPNVTTHSEGEGKGRRVIIIPENLGQVSASQSQQDGGYPYSGGGNAYGGNNNFRQKGPARTKSFGYNGKKGF